MKLFLSSHIHRKKGVIDLNAATRYRQFCRLNGHCHLPGIKPKPMVMSTIGC